VTAFECFAIAALLDISTSISCRGTSVKDGLFIGATILAQGAFILAGIAQFVRDLS